MKTENGYTALQFVAYLRNQLIPDFRAADMHATAEDFETALQFICGLADERAELIAALKDIGEYKGEGGPNTPWRDIVRDIGNMARNAVAGMDTKP